MKLVARVELSTSASFIDLTNVPQDADDLLVVLQLRNAIASTSDVFVRFNGDSGVNYKGRRLVGQGTSVAASLNETGSWVIPNASASTATAANTFGYGQLYIPNYRSSSQKAGSSKLGLSGVVAMGTHRWTGTAAITSIRIDPSGDAAAGSTVWLYTITKA
jgi:hypothetical protein